MDIDVKNIDETTVVINMDGDIDIYSSSDLKDALLEQVDLGVKNIIIDLEHVLYIDSSGIGIFISTLAALKKLDGKICIIKITEPVRKVFELTKLTSFFRIYEDEESALESLNES